MADATFWRKLKKEFTDLAEEEHRAIPDPSDGRRLHAYGDYIRGRGDLVGRWQLNDGLSADFRILFEETATLAGSALDPPRGAKPLHFWLHRLFHQLLEIDELSNNRGHLVGDRERGGIVRDVCTASAIYCSVLAKAALEHEVEQMPNRRSPKEFIDDHRRRPKRSYEKFAAKIGISKDTLYAITKETRWVSDENYRLVAEVCGCQPAELHPRDVPRPERRRS